MQTLQINETISVISTNHREQQHNICIASMQPNSDGESHLCTVIIMYVGLPENEHVLPTN